MAAASGAVPMTARREGGRGEGGGEGGQAQAQASVGVAVVSRTSRL
jgi:hypothetical protein